MSRFDLIPPDAPKISTRGSDFWLHDGLLYGRTRFSAPHGELDDAVTFVERMRELTGGTPLPLLFDARHVGWLQVKARDHVHRHAAELFTRAAVIVTPTMSRVLGYSLLGNNRLQIPVELFATEDEAWEFATATPVP